MDNFLPLLYPPIIHYFYRPKFSLIAEPITIENSKAMCMKIFRSQIFVPMNEEENDLLYNETISFAPQCKSPSHSSGYLWLGADDKDHDGEYITYDVCTKIDHLGRYL